MTQETPVLEQSYEMGTDHASFRRLLPLGLPGATIAYDGSAGTGATIKADFQENGQTACVQISLAAETVRAIALIRLPVTQVTFSFFGLQKDSARRHLDRVMLAMQRGGG